MATDDFVHCFVYMPIRRICHSGIAYCSVAIPENGIKKQTLSNVYSSWRFVIQNSTIILPRLYIAAYKHIHVIQYTHLLLLHSKNIYFCCVFEWVFIVVVVLNVSLLTTTSSPFFMFRMMSRAHFVSFSWLLKEFNLCSYNSWTNRCVHFVYF